MQRQDSRRQADGPPVIFLMGPTAAGKTELAVELVRQLPCEIVSVDSAMVYRGMDIGTAKPGPELLAQAPHRLIDILDPAEAYSAGRFRTDALREIAEIRAHGRMPLLVGGTMLYFRALQQGLSELPSAAPELRAQLAGRAARAGWPALHAELAALDPEAARRIHPNDAQRIQRALEIHALSGSAPSTLYRTPPAGPDWPLLKLALCPRDRAELRERLARRFAGMMQRGFLQEVAALRARGDLDVERPALRAVGYRQLWRHLEGHWPLAEAVERGIHASRQLAKRQLTWLRRESGLCWLDGEGTEALAQIRRELRLLGARV